MVFCKNGLKKKCINNGWVHFECTSDDFTCYECTLAEISIMKETNDSAQKQLRISQYLLNNATLQMETLQKEVDFLRMELEEFERFKAEMKSSKKVLLSNSNEQWEATIVNLNQ